ncbi:MAG: hypothetical protein LBT14_02610 [Treponema sp.]|jgi:hypothetical protein|nr:hypothetical protein [Treponema sp.]
MHTEKQKKHTMFICLGGTGTQIGGTISNLYPLLKQSGIADAPYEMFILDKDASGGIYSACVTALDRYKAYFPFLPFEPKALKPYTLYSNVYQELQGVTEILQNADYTVMDLIGNDSPMKELASMCWIQEKRDESIRDGNNRDPSRGSLDALVCLEHFESCVLFEKFKAAVDNYGETGVRAVILGGATGGMGSSLIVPLAEKIKSHFADIRIDLVILGTYFSIPQRSEQQQGKVDDIGSTQDSFYRVADQIKELADDLVGNERWWVYYAAIPELDDICGEFRKNKADKRKSHLLELAAALAAFRLESLPDPGFYQTALAFDKTNPKTFINWGEIPLGNELKKPARDFMRLISIMACQVLPSFSQAPKELEKDHYVKRYIKKPQNEMEQIEEIRDLLKKWLQDLVPYFEFWNEIQLNTKLGDKGNRDFVKFFPLEDMEYLSGILAFEKEALLNKMLFCQETWMDFLEDIKPDKKAIASAETSKDLLIQMIKDIYRTLTARKED